MPSTSAYRGLTVPTNLGDAGVWGQELINTLGGLDTILGAQVTLSASVYGTSTVLSSAQAQNGTIIFGGTPTGIFTLTFDQTKYGRGSFLVYNNSTTDLICISTASSSVSTTTVPPGQIDRVFSWGNAITSESDGGSF